MTTLSVDSLTTDPSGSEIGVSQLQVNGSPGGVKLDVSIIGYEY